MSPVVIFCGYCYYTRMSFGLLNAGSTFQRAMDHAFEGLIGKIIESYLDDLTVFSKEREDHVNHLSRVFERCRKFGILLDPKNSIFALSGEGISGEGIKSARDSSHSSTQGC